LIISEHIKVDDARNYCAVFPGQNSLLFINPQRDLAYDEGKKGWEYGENEGLLAISLITSVDMLVRFFQTKVSTRGTVFSGRWPR